MSSRLFIIAEAGVNHNGSLGRALDLVDAAAAAGADAVKFQTFSVDALVTVDAKKAAYQLEATSDVESQHAMLKRLELSPDDHVVLSDRCRLRNVVFMSAAFDVPSIELLLEIGVDRLKIPSGEMTNTPYLRRVAAAGLPVLLSTGMATLGEVASSLAILESAGCPRDRVTVLHCTTDYPARPQDVNLRAMVTMGENLGVDVGYSDHTEGITVSVAAAALGASVIEKHFTLDRSLPGPDQRASLEPTEFSAMVNAVRLVESALGDGIKRPSAAELKNAIAARKSVVAARPIRAGEMLTADALTAKRPGDGISPLLWDEIVGHVATRDYAADEQIAERL